MKIDSKNCECTCLWAQNEDVMQNTGFKWLYLALFFLITYTQRFFGVLLKSNIRHTNMVEMARLNIMWS